MNGVAAKKVRLSWFTHSIRHNSPSDFEALRAFLFGSYYGHGIDTDALIEKQIALLEQMGDAEGKTSEQIYDLAVEEVVCNAMEKMLLDSEAVSYLTVLREANSGLFAKLQSLIERLTAKLKTWYAGSLTSEESRAVEQLGEDLAMLKGLFIKAAENATGRINNTRTGDGTGVRNSVKVTSRMDYDKQLQMIENRSLNGGNSLYVGKISSLSAIGFSDVPFVMNQADYRKSRRTEGKNAHYSSHAVPLSFFKDMPGRLQNASMFIDNGDRISVITDYPMQDKKGNPSFVIAGVWRNQTMDGEKVNLVKSVYPLDDIALKIAKAAEDGTLVVTNKNKVSEIMTDMGLQLSEQSRFTDLARDTLSQSSANVNTYFEKNKNSVKNSVKSQNIADAYDDYDKPITREDITKLREMFPKRKSINDFTSDEIKATQKWAYKYYQQMGTRSPFFRAWFGDWRQYSKDDSVIVEYEYGEHNEINTSKRTVRNEDSTFDIVLDDNIVNDSEHYAAIHGDKKQTEQVLGRIDEIVKNAILLDTQTSEPNKGNKKGSTLFMHYFYTPITINNAPFLVKLTVEEYGTNGDKRGYNIKRIKMSTLQTDQFSKIIRKPVRTGSSAVDTVSIADLYSLVKRFDKDFSAGKPVNSNLLDEKGEPKVFYHGTTRFGFTEFAKRKYPFSDEDSIFFFSSSLRVAQSYSGKSGVSSLAEATEPVDPFSLSGEELADFINSHSGEQDRYEYRDGMIEVDGTPYRYSLESAAKLATEYAQTAGNYAVYLKADNVLVVDNGAESNRRIPVPKEFADKNSVLYKYIKYMSTDEIVSTAKEYGYDCVVFKNIGDSWALDFTDEKSDVVAVMSNTQIKSATDNIGTFDRGTGNIKNSYKLQDAAGKTSEDIIDLSTDSKLSSVINGKHGSERYKLIREYILNELAEQPIELSDGKSVIVDKSDASHIAHKAGSKKTAEISKIKKIISSALLYAEESSKDRTDKFSYYYYYKTTARYENETFPVVLNVGMANNDRSYHLYDITNKIRDTAHRVNDVERLSESFALENGISNDTILTEKNKDVKQNFEKNIKNSYKIQTDKRDLLEEALSKTDGKAKTFARKYGALFGKRFELERDIREGQKEVNRLYKKLETLPDKTVDKWSDVPKTVRTALNTFIDTEMANLSRKEQKDVRKTFAAEDYKDTKKYYLTKTESEYLESKDGEASLTSSKYSDVNSISDLYSLVKRFDKDFSAIFRFVYGCSSRS